MCLCLSVYSCMSVCMCMCVCVRVHEHKINGYTCTSPCFQHIWYACMHSHVCVDAYTRRCVFNGGSKMHDKQNHVKYFPRLFVQQYVSVCTNTCARGSMRVCVCVCVCVCVYVRTNNYARGSKACTVVICIH